MKKILVLGASNSSRPPIKCWPEYVAEYFNDVELRNAALRGATPEHIYDMYICSLDFEPDLVLVDLPPWYRSYIPVNKNTREIEIDHIIKRKNYSEVVYKTFIWKGIVPIGGFIPMDKIGNINYAEWLKSQNLPNSKLTLYDLYKRRAENKDDFDVTINFLNDVRLSDFYKRKSYKDMLLFEKSVQCEYKYIHTIGPFPTFVNDGNYLSENPFDWVINNFKNYEDMFEDEWAHFTEDTHRLVAEKLYIPNIERLIYE
jgi:hypothetical protein